MEIQKYVGNKIKHYRLTKNITQEELGEYLGTTSQTISRYENGERDPGHTTLFKIADYFKVSINEFFPPAEYDNAIVINQNYYDTVKIPVLGVIKAGIPVEAQENILEQIDIPKEWTKGGKQFYGLKIDGDSMYPNYENNDIVIFEKTEDYTKGIGKDCAVMVNGYDATFKKVLMQNDSIILQPYNSNYDISVYNKKQIEELPVRIIGVAREKRTRL